jgi:hypothetical protein
MAPVLERPGLEDEIAASVVASVGCAQLQATPFPHWVVTGVLPEEAARDIAALPFAPTELNGESGRRELHNPQRRYAAGEVLREHPVARALALAFQSIPVVTSLAVVTGVVLAGAFLRIEFALDLDGFWLEPHTDLGVKLLTLFLQLAGPGQESLGTDLYSDATTWAVRAPFAWNAALVFAPSERSWHGFEPRPIEGVRRSVIVNYVTNEWRSREQLAFPDRPTLSA